MEGVGGESFHSKYFVWRLLIPIHKDVQTWNSQSKVDQVPTIVLTQGVQEMQTVVFSGSPEPCVSNLGFSHECSGVLMFVLKIK